MTVIVPYRDRREHLVKFLEHFRDYPNLYLVVVEQADDKPFNRGKLLNIGFLEIDPDIFVCHDVDMLPLNVNYAPRKGVTQLAMSNIQMYDYLGGVTMFDKDSFVLANGYPNNFHRAEDNCMMFTLKRLGIPVRYRIGNFKTLTHARPALEFDPAAWAEAQKNRGVLNGLTDCKYSCTRIQMDNYTLLKCIT